MLHKLFNAKNLETSTHSNGAASDRWHSIVQSMMDCLIVVDANATIQIVNPAALKLLGYSEGELIDRPIDHILVRGSYRGSGFETLAEQGILGSGEKVFRSKTGKQIPVWYSGAVLRGVDNHVEGVVIIANDITSQKKAEQDLRSHLGLFKLLHQLDTELSSKYNAREILQWSLTTIIRLTDASAGYIATHDPNCADEVEEIVTFGYQRNPANPFSPTHSTVVKKSLQARQPHIMKCVPTSDYCSPNARVRLVMPLISNDRSVGVINLESSDNGAFPEDVYRFLKLFASRVASTLEGARLFQLANDQVSELQKLYEHVKRLEELKSEMVRMAAHDLRDPLGRVFMNVEMIRMVHPEILTDPLEKRISSISEAVQHMNKMISDILSLERIEKLALHQLDEDVDLTELVKSAAAKYVDDASAKQLVYNVKLPSQAVIVRGEPRQLHEAVTNFITNAIKYTPENGTVTVQLSSTHDTISVEIVDTGYGILEEEQERLFQPFSRAYSDEVRDIEGTGLGLHLVKSIVERHGGQVFFSSTYRKGSTFGFHLPCRDSNAKASA